MRTRHQRPTLVSMWMLDVFCCALGCVTLLWLLNTREAKLRAVSLGDTTARLAEVKAGLKAANAKAAEDALSYRVETNALEARLLALVKERDDTATQLALMSAKAAERASELALAELDFAELMKMLSASETDLADAKSRLTQSKTNIETLTKQSADARKQIESMQSVLRDKEKLVADLESGAKVMVKSADAAATEMARRDARIKALEKQVSDANVSIIDLQGTKAKLADKVNQLRVEQESRFAGIAMTGKKVLFLIDVSGSMALLKYGSPLPTKWPLVRETVLKVMKSLPELESFQVIVFADKMTYLLGSDGDWLKYEGAASGAKVEAALAKITPENDTNLYLPMEAAFKFRAKGMDAVYLFSDGLPTQGPGLSSLQVSGSEVLTAGQKSEIMGNFIRTQLRTTWNAERPNEPRVKINTIGFFYESPDLGAFLWSLSRENDGSFVGMSRP